MTILPMIRFSPVAKILDVLVVQKVVAKDLDRLDRARSRPLRGAKGQLAAVVPGLLQVLLYLQAVRLKDAKETLIQVLGFDCSVPCL